MTNPEAAPVAEDDDQDPTLHTERYREMRTHWEKMVAEIRYRNNDKYAVKAPGDVQYRWKTLAQLRQDFATWKLMEERNDGQRPRRVLFVNVWISDPEHRSYREAQLRPPPLDCEPDVLNTWTGFAALHADPPEDIRTNEGLFFIIRHVWLLVGGDVDEEWAFDNEAFNYVMSWLAHLVQRPGELTRTALVLRSRDTGTGKSAFLKFVGNMIGLDWYRTYQKAGRITSNFADAMRDRLLVALQDPTPADIKKNLLALMYRVDTTLIEVEIKMGPTLQLDNVCRFVFTTNQDTIPLQHDDRRVAMVESNPWLGQKSEPHYKAYHDKRDALFNDRAMQRAFHDFLMAIPIDDMDWIADRPICEAYASSRRLTATAAQVRQSSMLDIFEDWCATLLTHGTRRYMGTTTKIYNEFIPYCASRSHFIAEGYDVRRFGWDMRDMPGWDRKLVGSKRWIMLPTQLENYLVGRGKLSRKRKATPPPDSDDES